MPKKTADLGLVSLKQEPDGRWRVRWWDARLRKYFRRIIPATSYSEAVAMAKMFNQQLASDKGFAVPSVRAKSGLGVNQAVEEMIRNSDTSGKSRANYISAGNLFLAWLRENKPGVSLWSDVNTKTLLDYVRYCESQGLAFDTVRLRFHVLRATSLYASETYPEKYSHVAKAVKIKRQRGAASSADERPLLTARELMALLDHVKIARPGLHGVMALQGLAGMRILEAVYIREADVDFAQGTVSVGASAMHTPKTASSHRTIPVAGEVLSILRGQIDSLKVRHPQGFIFLSERGEPWSHEGIAHTLKKLYTSAWRETGLECLRDFMPRRLRAVFVNLVREKRADYRTVQSYIGHISRDVMGKHYEQASIDRMRVEVVAGTEEAIVEARQVEESGQRMASDLH